MSIKKHYDRIKMQTINTIYEDLIKWTTFNIYFIET